MSYDGADRTAGFWKGNLLERALKSFWPFIRFRRLGGFDEARGLLRIVLRFGRGLACHRNYNITPGIGGYAKNSEACQAPIPR